MFVGIMLLLIGLLLLLERMGFIYGGIGNYILPVVLIAFGCSMVFRNKRKL